MNFSTFKRNLILSTDSYKISHVQQWPENIVKTRYYIESRGGEYDEVMVLGSHFVARVINEGVDMMDLTRANMLCKAHFGRDLLAYDLWLNIIQKKGGKLPVDIFAIPEGMVVPTKVPVMIIESTDPDYVWLPGALETFTLRAIWYPSTVAAISYKSKQHIKAYLEATSDLTGDDFDFVLKTRLHDFGARGVSSEESARIGGAAHMMNFIGTDTMEAMMYLQDLYNMPWDYAPGISIAAREHSTTVSYGSNGGLTAEQEDQAFLNSIKKFGAGVYACVMDSVSFKKAVDRVSTKYKQMIIDAGGTFVFRPDSGDMFDNIEFALNCLADNFGYTMNSKGKKVLHPSCRIIQGDGLNGPDDVLKVLQFVTDLGFSTENIAFGMGGGLLQQCDRDTQKWAEKICAVTLDDGSIEGVRKCPEGAEWKASKAGVIETVRDLKTGELVCIDINNDYDWHHELVMEQIVANGESLIKFNQETFEQTRALADSHV